MQHLKQKIHALTDSFLLAYRPQEYIADQFAGQSRQKRKTAHSITRLQRQRALATARACFVDQNLRREVLPLVHLKTWLTVPQKCLKKRAVAR